MLMIWFDLIWFDLIWFEMRWNEIWQSDELKNGQAVNRTRICWATINNTNHYTTYPFIFLFLSSQTMSSLSMKILSLWYLKNTIHLHSYLHIIKWRFDLIKSTEFWKCKNEMMKWWNDEMMKWWNDESIWNPSDANILHVWLLFNSPRFDSQSLIIVRNSSFKWIDIHHLLFNFCFCLSHHSLHLLKNSIIFTRWFLKLIVT
jgi:hypothetical protein